MSAGRCRACGCTETAACAEGCAWTDDTRLFCTACAFKLIELAFQISDPVSRDDIERHARLVTSGKRHWYDLDSVEARHTETVRAAMEYMRLRGPNLGGFTVHHCQAFPHLVRFEDIT